MHPVTLIFLPSPYVSVALILGQIEFSVVYSSWLLSLPLTTQAYPVFHLLHSGKENPVFCYEWDQIFENKLEHIPSNHY